MILESLIAPLGGGLLRLLPEALKFFDRKSERHHELAMFDKQLQADAQKSAEQLALIQAQHAATADTKDLEALIAGVTAQGQRSGVGWADALNTLVRPILTFWWCVVLATVAFAARWVMLTDQGVGYADALLQLWGSDERAIVASMISFWFVDRALRRGGGLGAAH